MITIPSTNSSPDNDVHRCANRRGMVGMAERLQQRRNLLWIDHWCGRQLFDEWNMEIVFTSSLQKNPSTVGLARYLTRRMEEPTMMRMTTSIMKVTGNVILAKLTSMWGVNSLWLRISLPQSSKLKALVWKKLKWDHTDRSFAKFWEHIFEWEGKIYNTSVDLSGARRQLQLESVLIKSWGQVEWPSWKPILTIFYWF